MTSDTSHLLAALRAAVGDQHVLADADMRAGYETDWTRRWHGKALAVVRPASVDQVAAVVSACADAGATIIPQGGNTGLVGGSVPRRDSQRPQVVLSTTRLRDLEPADASAGEVTVGAGVTLGALQAHARGAGFDFGVDLGARDSATIGGMVATNAGGMQVLRHGPMRAQVIGLEAVLADGSVVRRLPGLMKDNTGYHLPSLLAGSEGTLAIITRVRLRLRPLRSRRASALCAVDDTAAAVSLLGMLRERLPDLLAAELFFEEGMALVLAHAGIERPFAEPHPAYLLVEVDGATDPTPELAAALDAAGELVRDAVLAADPVARARLWRIREGHTEAVNAVAVPHKLDVAVPISRLVAFVDALGPTVSAVAPDASVITYGHIADGNMHVTVLGPSPEDEAADDAVLQLTIDHGGTISAEHGIGTAKVHWLARDRGAADVAAMRAIKQALDPGNVLNPGVLLPA
ncbi:MAG TPA: FAD-binding oxidoreductase [Candidatus Limnocylindria bacterium]